MAGDVAAAVGAVSVAEKVVRQLDAIELSTNVQWLKAARDLCPRVEGDEIKISTVVKGQPMSVTLTRATRDRINGRLAAIARENKALEKSFGKARRW